MFLNEYVADAHWNKTRRVRDSSVSLCFQTACIIIWKGEKSWTETGAAKLEHMFLPESTLSVEQAAGPMVTHAHS